MTVSEYISALADVKISDADGHDLKKKYGRDIPKIILQIASYDEKAVFLDTALHFFQGFFSEFGVNGNKTLQAVRMILQRLRLIVFMQAL